MSKFKKYILEGINDKYIFKSCFMSGSSASGKSYVIKQIGSTGIKMINTDIWTEYHMKFDHNYTWDKYGNKDKQLTKAQLSNYINSLLPLWIDGTSANSSSVLRRKGILQSIGYDTAMVFVDTPVETAIKRNEARGRVVDVEFLKQSYKESQKLKSYYKSQFDPFIEIKNGEGELTDEIILKSYKKMNKFFSSSIKNPIGQDIKEQLIKSDKKYLIDMDNYDMNYINKLVDSWYRR